MNKTPDIDQSKLIQEIDDFVAKLENEQIDEFYANRLRQLSIDLKNQTKTWIGLDIFQVFNPKILNNKFNFIYQNKVQKNINTWEWIRTILTMIIFIFCGTAIYSICSIYQTLPLSQQWIEKPFFALWNEGFQGNLQIFFTVRWVSIVIIIFFVIIIILNQFIKQTAAQTRYHASVQSENITSHLIHLLWLIQYSLIEQRIIINQDAEQRSIILLENISSFVDKFKDNSHELENIIKNEQQRLNNLANRQQDEIDQLSNLGSYLKGFFESFSKSVDQYENTLSGFQTIVSTLSREGEQYYANQKKQLDILVRTDSQLDNFEKEVTRLTQVQRKIYHDLLNATQQNMEKANELRSSIDLLNSSTRRVGEGQINLQNLLDDQMRANDSWVRSVGQSVNTMNDILKSIEQFIHALPTSTSISKNEK